MNRENRAKQFMPFDALKGLREELQKREERRLKQSRKELVEEDIVALTQALNALKRGVKIEVTYYDVITERYVKKRDNFIKLNRELRFLKTENYNIYFDDLLEINICGE